MREYGKIFATFWTGETGQALQRFGHEAVIMAAYLMSCSHSNMLGLFRIPLGYAAEETGLGFEGACKGMQGCIATGFCYYDPSSKFVWVVEMAHWQIEKKLKSIDKRVIGVRRSYAQLPDNPFLEDWFLHYSDDFLLDEPRSSKGLPSPTEAITGPGSLSPGPGPGYLPPTDVGGDELQKGLGKGLVPINGHDLLGDPLATARVKRNPPVDFEGVRSLFHEILCPPLPTTNKLDDERRKHIRARWQNDLPDLASWKDYFEDVTRSAWLMGRSPGRDGKPFRCTFDYLIKASSYRKISEGNFHDE